MKRVLSILLVEDSLPEQDLIVEIFDMTAIAEFTVETTVRLSDARAYLNRSRPDLIILDLGLPDSDGLDSLLAVLEAAHDIPVVVLTGDDAQETGQEAIRLGAQDFWTKGNGNEKLLPRISLYAIERHQARLKTEASRFFLLNTIDALADHVAIVDQNGTAIQTNKAWRSFAASLPPDKQAYYSPGNNYRKNCVDLIRRNSSGHVDVSGKVQQFLDGQSDFLDIEYEFTNVVPSKWFHLKVTAFSINSLKYLVFAHHDISARKRAELAREQSRNLFRAVFDSSPNLVCVKDKEGRFVMVNKSMAAIYDCSYQEMVGKTVQEILFSKGMEWEQMSTFQEEAIDPLLQSMPTKINEAEPLTDHSGNTSWYRTIKTPMTIQGGDTHLLLIAIDVSRDLENQAKIRESEYLFRTLLNALHLNIILLDKNLQLIWANDRARAHCENRGKEIAGISCKELECGSGNCTKCPAHIALKTGQLKTETITDLTGKTIRMTGCPIYSESGDVGKVVVISEDISERVSLERQLRQAQKMESLGTLAGGIAHDFNNILTAIIGFTELALHSPETSLPLNNDLKEIMAAGLRAKDLVHQILTFSRQVEQELRPLDISLVVKEAIKLLKATLPSSIRLSSNVPSNLGNIIADPTQIHQVVMNLCTNAAHALKNQDGEIDITLSRRHWQNTQPQLGINQDLIPGPYIELRIQDTGSGISEEHLPFIFDPYFTTKDIGEGTGLGLAVIHGIVKDCGGDIQVSSTLGEGTIFSLLFPVNVDTETEQHRIIINEEIYGNGEQILVVDDEPPILLMCRKVLEKRGYSVHTEKDPREALRYLTENPQSVDLMLSDIVMPYIQGDRLAEKAREIKKNLPVILMSGNITNLPHNSELSESVELITKPLDINYLLTCIKKCFEGNST